MALQSGSLEGYDELLKILRTLGDDKVVNKLLKDANRDSLKDVQKGIKGLPFPKNLTKEVRIRATKVEGTKNPTALVVGPTTDAFPLRWLERGTVERYTKAGSYRGYITGRNAIEPFIDDQARTIQKDAPSAYGEKILRAVERYTKKINRNK